MKRIGILTAGGDSPGLNAAIHAVYRVLNGAGYKLIGFQGGFDGAVFDRTIPLNDARCSGILSKGGTILHTSRTKPDKMVVNGKEQDMTGAILENYRKHELECLICIGGGGTHKHAALLQQLGLNILTIPKTIDNDIPGSDCAIGFDTALGVATQAIDNLQSTASSHRRIMLLEVMGHNTGWLALGSGIAGGADMILIPEIPFSLKVVADTLIRRAKKGKEFCIVPVAEGAMSDSDYKNFRELKERRAASTDAEERAKLKREMKRFQPGNPARIFELADQLEEMTDLETRVTILGHLQRGGAPSAADRLLAIRCGHACAEWALQKQYGVMAALRGNTILPIPIAEGANGRKSILPDDPWLTAARGMGISFGEK